jgi:hypothetical protein
LAYTRLGPWGLGLAPPSIASPSVLGLPVVLADGESPSLPLAIGLRCSPKGQAVRPPFSWGFSQGLHRGNPTLALCPGSLGYGAPLCPMAVNSPTRPYTTPSGLGKGHSLLYHAFGPWERAPSYRAPGDPFGLRIVPPLRITRPGPSPASGLYHPLLYQASPPTPPYDTPPLCMFLYYLFSSIMVHMAHVVVHIALHSVLMYVHN